MGNVLRGLRERAGPAPYPLVIILALLSQLPFSVAAQGAGEGNAELLKSIAMMLEENKGRIKYWQGKANMEFTPGQERPLRPDTADGTVGYVVEKSTAVFWYSADLDATRWSVSRESWFRDGNGRVISDAHQTTYDEMVKDKTFYRYMDYFEKKEGRGRKGLTIWPSSKARQGGMSTAFDPMHTFTLHSVDVVEKLQTYRVLIMRGTQGIEVHQEGQRVILQESIDQTVMKHTFDLSQGGNQIEYYCKTPEGVVAIDAWTYENKDGVWVPKTWTFTRNGQRERGVTFIISKVNELIPASEFSIESLGVKPGDPVSDTVLGITYRYKELLNDLPDIPKDIPYKNAVLEQRSEGNRPPSSADTSVVGSRKGKDHGDQDQADVLAVGRAEEAGPRRHAYVWATAVVAAMFLMAFVAVLKTRRRDGGGI